MSSIKVNLEAAKKAKGNVTSKVANIGRNAVFSLGTNGVNANESMVHTDAGLHVTIANINESLKRDTERIEGLAKAFVDADTKLKGQALMQPLKVLKAGKE